MQTKTLWMDCAVGITDRLSSMHLLMGVESNSGVADLGAAITWQGDKVAVRFSSILNCSFVFQSFDSRVFELVDCVMAQSSPG